MRWPNGLAAAKEVVLVVRVEVPGHPAEHRHVAVGERSAVDVLLALLDRVERLADAPAVLVHAANDAELPRSRAPADVSTLFELQAAGYR